MIHKNYFERQSPELRAYMKKFLPKEYAKFQERIAGASQSTLIQSCNPV